MAKHDSYEEKTEALVLPVLEKLSLSLVDVEYVKEAKDWYLRVYIDKEGGVTIDDCESVSRALSDLLDEEDFIEDAYILEVSSPGLGRAVKKDKDLERNMGKMLDIRLYHAADGTKEMTGVLKAYDKDTLTVEQDGAETVWNRRDISKISEHVEW